VLHLIVWGGLPELLCWAVPGGVGTEHLRPLPRWFLLPKHWAVSFLGLRSRQVKKMAHSFLLFSSFFLKSANRPRIVRE
jgi:hypothetical protein